MIAPVCRVCEKENDGYFIQFKVVEPEEVKLNKQIDEMHRRGETFYGHPAGNWFFCHEHSGLGWKYRHLTWKEAEPLIRQAFETGEIPKPHLRVIDFLDRISSKIGNLFKRN